MKLKPPIKGYKNSLYPQGNVTQWFGENKELYSSVCVNSENCLQGHNGMDIVSSWGTPIMAVEGGVVVDVKNDPKGYGKHVRILSDVIEGKGREWTYGHASVNLVKVGQKVEAGQVIQKMGNTGFVVSGNTPFWKYNPYAGTHLHLGMREYVLDPKGWRYNENVPRIKILNYSNGFFGSVDFRELLSDDDSEKLNNALISLNSLLNILKNFLIKR